MDGEQRPETVKTVADVPCEMAGTVPNRKNRKFAFACAMLASMTSILLGYGMN